MLCDIVTSLIYQTSHVTRWAIMGDENKYRVVGLLLNIYQPLCSVVNDKRGEWGVIIFLFCGRYFQTQTRSLRHISGQNLTFSTKIRQQ